MSEKLIEQIHFLQLHPRNQEVSRWYDDILLSLKELRHLDVSYGGNGCALTCRDDSRYVFKIMKWPDCLPNLISLDISGMHRALYL